MVSQPADFNDTSPTIELKIWRVGMRKGVLPENQKKVIGEFGSDWPILVKVTNCDANTMHLRPPQYLVWSTWTFPVALQGPGIAISWHHAIRNS